METSSPRDRSGASADCTNGAVAMGLAAVGTRSAVLGAARVASQGARPPRPPEPRKRWADSDIVTVPSSSATSFQDKPHGLNPSDLIEV